jgi:ribosomal protein S4
MAYERLQKYMARCGIASRRKCEEIIMEGRVEVNGSVVRDLGIKVDPEVDVVKVDGERAKRLSDELGGKAKSVIRKLQRTGALDAARARMEKGEPNPVERAWKPLRELVNPPPGPGGEPGRDKGKETIDG